MPKLPGVPHLRAVKALRKIGYLVVRQGAKHVVLSNGLNTVTVPRNDPINAYTMGAIISDAGLTVDQFKKLL